MLSFDIRALEAQAEHVAGELLPTDPVWQGDDPLPQGHLVWHCALLTCPDILRGQAE